MKKVLHKGEIYFLSEPQELGSITTRKDLVCQYTRCECAKPVDKLLVYLEGKPIYSPHCAECHGIIPYN